MHISVTNTNGKN